MGSPTDAELPPLKISWITVRGEESIVLNKDHELEEGEALLHKLDQASVYIVRMYKRSMATDAALRKIAPILAEAESVMKERDEIRSKSRDVECELKAEIERLRNGNFELHGSLGTSSTKISPLQQAKKRADEKIKAILTDNATLEQEFEDYKADAQSNLEQYEVQLETMDTECRRLSIAAAPMLGMLYPASAGSNSESVKQIASLLKTASERVKGLVKEHATISCSQALSITKSLYPRVDIIVIGEGYAAGTLEEKALQLVNEVHGVAATIAEDSVDM